MAAAQAALRAAGHDEPTPRAVRTLVGLPLDVVLNSLAGGDRPDDEVADLCDRYRRYFRTVVTGRTELFDGVAGAVRKLHGAGVYLAVATSRGLKSLEKILEYHGLSRYFSMLITDDCVKNGKPDPEMLRSVMRELGIEREKSVMIGDTVYDLRMGHAAGMDTCAVTYGFHPADELRAEHPTYVVAHAREIPGVLA